MSAINQHIPRPKPTPPSICGVAVVVTDSNSGEPIFDAEVHVGDLVNRTNKDGFVFFWPVAVGRPVVTVEKEGFYRYEGPYFVSAPNNEIPITITAAKPAHVDPSTIPLETLANIRGSMWTARLNLPFGPRPNQDSNILAMAALPSYDEATQLKMIEAYKSRGYTHAVIGAWRPGPWSPYHDHYPERTVPFDEFLDILERLWDNGLTPVVFVRPDEWTLGDLQSLEPYYRSERAQRLCRVVVPAGWEPGPKYFYDNDTFVSWLEWGKNLFPNALRLLHMVSDIDAPTGGDDDRNILGGNAECWRRTVPLIHGWLNQSSAFEDPLVHGDPNHPEKTNFQNWVALFDKNVRGSFFDRFHNGYANWPTGSAFGPNVPIRVYAAEFAAYWSYWHNRPEAESVNWGNAALLAGADGYLDGGSLPVPLI